jgi:hypothetical protein
METTRLPPPERARDWQHRRDTGAAADADAGSPILDLGGLAEGPDHLDRVPLLHGAHLHRRLADLLDDQGDGARLRVGVGDGQRNPLPVIVEEHDHELTGAVLAGHLRRAHQVALELGGNLLDLEQLRHPVLPRSGEGPPPVDPNRLHHIKSHFGC